MSNIDTAKLKSGVNLIDLASKYTTLNRESPREYSGPCPKCGGSDRFHCTETTWFCRNCNPLGNGKAHDVISLLQWAEGLTFVDACHALSSGYTPTVTHARPAAQAHPVNAWNEQYQIAEARKAHSTLIGQRTDEARAALVYLQGRTIDLTTINAFKIGVRQSSLPGTWDKAKNLLTYPKQASISLPWFDQSGALIAVKYRFLADHTYTNVGGKMVTNNKTSKGNFSGHVFGWQAIKGPDVVDTLIICEGEMNCLSIWQAGNGTIDTLSTGTESMIEHLPQPVIDLAQRYRNVIVWADRREVARAAAAALPGAASMRSHVTPSYPKGMDANDTLKAGLLSDLLVGMVAKIEAAQPAIEPSSEGYTVPETTICNQYAPDGVGDIFGYIGKDIDAGLATEIELAAANEGWAANIVRTGTDTWRVMQIVFSVN